MYFIAMPTDRPAVNLTVVSGALVCSETLLGCMCAFVCAHTNKDHHLLPLWLKVRPSHICTTSIYLLMSKVLANPLPHQGLVSFQN